MAERGRNEYERHRSILREFLRDTRSGGGQRQHTPDHAAQTAARQAPDTPQEGARISEQQRLMRAAIARNQQAGRQPMGMTTASMNDVRAPYPGYAPVNVGHSNPNTAHGTAMLRLDQYRRSKSPEYANAQEIPQRNGSVQPSREFLDRAGQNTRDNTREISKSGSARYGPSQNGHARNREQTRGRDREYER